MNKDHSQGRTEIERMGNRVKIITDSAADLPLSLQESLDITVLPMMVYFGEEEFRDGVDLKPVDFYQRLKNTSLLPKTAQPMLSEVKRAFETTIAEDRPALVIHISSGLSGTFTTSQMIAAEMLEQGREIRVIDSLSASIGQGMLVIEAAEMAQMGLTASEIEKEILRCVPKMNHLFVLDTMEYLLKGGRINKAQAVVGSVLDIKPYLYVNNDGYIIPRGKARGRRRSIEQLLNEVEVRLIDPSRQRVGVVHANAFDEAKSLVEEIKHRLAPKDIRLVEMTATVGTHVGPGLLGVVFESDNGRE